MFSKGLDIHDENLQERFEKAARLTLNTVVTHQGGGYNHVAWRVASFYKNSAQALWTQHNLATSDNSGLIMGVLNGARLATEIADQVMASATDWQYDDFYSINNDRDFHNDLLEPLADIVFNALSFASNDFTDYQHQYWTLVQDIFQHVFPSIGTHPDGMSPFQQRGAIKIERKLTDNMNGYYPSISKVLLAVLGPYERINEPGNKTANKILRDVTYKKLKNLRKLFSNEQKSWKDFLPNNVLYDPNNNTLEHKYRFGDSRVTNLSRIRPRNISLLRDDVFRPQGTVGIGNDY